MAGKVAVDEEAEDPEADDNIICWSLFAMMDSI